MDILTKAHKTFLLELSGSGVTFMLIGGYAVNFHGYPRYTCDLDIWLKPDEENKKKFILFLKTKGFSEAGLAKITTLDFSKPQVFHIGETETRIDFLTKILGVQFDDAYGQCAKLLLEKTEIPVIQFQHLIINKMLSGRPQDKADVEELQSIMKYKKKK
jgi:hypothetical protein